MSFQTDNELIRWKLGLRSSPSVVYQHLESDDGRAAFWAESAEEENGVIHFVFPSDFRWQGKVLARRPDEHFAVEYIGGTVVTFDLLPDGKGGTDLTLTDRGVGPQYRTEVIAGWASVLLALKASVDFDVDIRLHDPDRNWDHGYVEN